LLLKIRKKSYCIRPPPEGKKYCSRGSKFNGLLDGKNIGKKLFIRSEILI